MGRERTTTDCKPTRFRLQQATGRIWCSGALPEVFLLMSISSDGGWSVATIRFGLRKRFRGLNGAGIANSPGEAVKKLNSHRELAQDVGCVQRTNRKMLWCVARTLRFLHNLGVAQSLDKRYGEAACPSAQAVLPDGRLFSGKTAFDTRIRPHRGFVGNPPPKKSEKRLTTPLSRLR